MLRRNLSPSLVISVLALFVALGGTSYAALVLPKGSVGTVQLKKEAVSKKKLKPNAVVSKKVKNRSLLAKDFKAGQLPTGATGSTGATGNPGASGAPGAAGVPGARGPSDAYRDERETVPLFAVTGSLLPVVTTQTLPAGSYVLFGRANIVGGIVMSTLLCSLANDAAQNFTVASNATFPLAQTATTTLDAPGTVELKCSKSLGTPQIAQASITAIRVESLSG